MLQWLLSWWNLIFLIPFVFALLYLVLYTMSGITFGEADADGDAAITVAELGRYVEFGVGQTAARQDREQRPLTIARDSLVVLSRLAPSR